MATTITRKGQVTVPKNIRDSMNMKPGSKVIFDVNSEGDVVLRKSGASRKRRPDRFDRAIGSAEIKWKGTTDEYMELIRGYSDDPA